MSRFHPSTRPSNRVIPSRFIQLRSPSIASSRAERPLFYMNRPKRTLLDQFEADRRRIILIRFAIVLPAGRSSVPSQALPVVPQESGFRRSLPAALILLHISLLSLDPCCEKPGHEASSDEKNGGRTRLDACKIILPLNHGCGRLLLQVCIHYVRMSWSSIVCAVLPRASASLELGICIFIERTNWRSFRY